MIPPWACPLLGLIGCAFPAYGGQWEVALEVRLLPFGKYPVLEGCVHWWEVWICGNALFWKVSTYGMGKGEGWPLKGSV